MLCMLIIIKHIKMKEHFTLLGGILKAYKIAALSLWLEMRSAVRSLCGCRLVNLYEPPRTWSRTLEEPVHLSARLPLAVSSCPTPDELLGVTRVPGKELAYFWLLRGCDPNGRHPTGLRFSAWKASQLTATCGWWWKRSVYSLKEVLFWASHSE